MITSPPAPYIPYGDEVDLLCIDEDIFHFYETSDLPALDDSPDTDTSGFDGFSFTWEPSIFSPGEETVAEPDATCLETLDVLPRTKLDRIRSILKSPSIHFATDSKATEDHGSGDFLDLRHSTSRLSVGGKKAPPKKLRKKRMSVPGARSSFLSTRKSMSSILNEINISKEMRKGAESNKGCENSTSGGTLDLPKGIVQSGRGIGFTYNPQASRSRISLSSTTTNSCFKGISVLFSGRGSAQENIPRSRNEVMQQIYGSTWSLHTNEAQASTVTFGIPDGLGRRADSVDLQQR